MLKATRLDRPDAVPVAAGKGVLQRADSALRPALERFIASRFEAVYGARLRHFMPQLQGLYADDGSLRAAFGTRPAAHERLFLERYLDQPIEAYARRMSGRPVERRDIVEVGNLAGSSPGALRDLIVLLCEQLYQQGYQWVAFTGAARLCNSFSRLGLPLRVIAPAAIEHLDTQEREDWGRYYDFEPAVMLGDVTAGRQQLASDASPDQRLAALNAVGAP